MAVSNCQGTQVINIAIGLGGPWFITNLTGRHVIIPCVQLLQSAAFFQLGIVIVNLSSLLGVTMFRGHNKCLLSKQKAYGLLATYGVVVSGYSFYLWRIGALTGQLQC